MQYKHDKGNQNRAQKQLIMSKFIIVDWGDGTSDYSKEDDVVVKEGNVVSSSLGRKCLKGKFHHSTVSSVFDDIIIIMGMNI